MYQHAFKKIKKPYLPLQQRNNRNTAKETSCRRKFDSKSVKDGGLVVVKICLTTGQARQLSSVRLHSYSFDLVEEMHTLLGFSPVLLTRFSRNSVCNSRNYLLLVRNYNEQSNSAKSPREVARWMGEHAPVFPHQSDQVSVLHEPTEFYETLKVSWLIGSLVYSFFIDNRVKGTPDFVPRENKLEPSQLRNEYKNDNTFYDLARLQAVLRIFAYRENWM